MKRKLILAFDCGTQSTRAILFDDKGNILGKAKVAFTPYYSIKEGYCEQDASFYWDKFVEASKALKKKCQEDWKDIAAVSITTLRDTCVCVDREGKPLRPVILWLDRREAKPLKFPLVNRFLFRLIGLTDSVMKQSVVSPSNWIMQNEPEIWKKTYKYLMFSGYLNFKLTGKMVDSTANMIGHIPFDYKKKKWQSEHGLSRCLVPIPPDKLCDLVDPGDIIGNITDDAARETGIPIGTPIVAAGSDKGCETLGTGCICDGVASLSYGTTATMQITTEKYVEPSAFMPAYPSMIKNKYNPETQIYRGYWMLTWFKHEFAQNEEREAAERGIAAEDILNDLLATVPAGSDGLVLQPYWSPILKAPEARGAVIGFSDVHTRAHLYRAIIEGIGYGLIEGLLSIQKKAKVTIKYLTVSGGGSVSDAICQITADMFGLPVKRVQTYETSGLGAAIAGFLGIGVYTSVEEAQKGMVHYKDTFLPNEENHTLYAMIYEKVYKKMYSRVQPLYDGIRQVNNYLEDKKNGNKTL